MYEPIKNKGIEVRRRKLLKFFQWQELYVCLVEGPWIIDGILSLLKLKSWNKKTVNHPHKFALQKRSPRMDPCMTPYIKCTLRCAPCLWHDTRSEALSLILQAILLILDFRLHTGFKNQKQKTIENCVNFLK